jgi:DNA polymerase III subunit beta
MMDVTMASSDLLGALALPDRIVPRKPTIAALGGVKMIADGERLTVHATDLEMASVTHGDATVGSAGTVVVPHRALYDVLRTLPESFVRIQAAANAVVVTAAGYRGRFQTFDVDDYPNLPAIDAAAPALALPRETFGNLIARTRFAVTDDDSKGYQLLGTLLELPDGLIRLVSTDGHRLAKAQAARTGPAIEGHVAILPRRTLDALAGFVETGPESIEFIRGEAHLFFRSEGRTLISRTIDGKFPAYERVIPKLVDVVATVPRTTLATTVRRAGIVADSKTRRVDLALASASLAVSAKSASIGDAAESVVVTYDGKEIAVGINGHYLLDFLDAAETESVTMQATEPTRPVVLSAVGGEIAYTYVLMPMVA